MKLIPDAVLDKLEYFFTKRPKRRGNKPFPQLQVWLHPSLLLNPTETYSLQLYRREATVPAIFMLAYMIITRIIIFGALWFQRPWLFADPRYHRLLIGFLSHEGIYAMPVLWAFFVALSFALQFPRLYFWNRRAVRLRNEPPEPEPSQIEDATVWPPPPRRPAV